MIGVLKWFNDCLFEGATGVSKKGPTRTHLIELSWFITCPLCIVPDDAHDEFIRDAIESFAGGGLPPTCNSNPCARARSAARNQIIRGWAARFHSGPKSINYMSTKSRQDCTWSEVIYAPVDFRGIDKNIRRSKWSNFSGFVPSKKWAKKGVQLVLVRF